MTITEKPQKIFISLDDSIPYVLDLINSAQSTYIILVIEESSGVISTLVSMKVLLREIIKLGKIAIIQTRDQKAKYFGNQVGFIVVEQTSDISSETWKEAEKANDTFKSIYASRKEDLAMKRKSEAVTLKNNIQDDSIWKKNLSVPEENINFDDVLDIPVISTIEENLENSENTSKNLNDDKYLTNGSETIRNENNQPSSKKDLKSPKTISSKNYVERIVPNILDQNKKEVVSPVYEDLNISQSQEVKNEEFLVNFSSQELKNDIPSGSVKISQKEAKRPSFEELYRKAKEKKSGKEVMANETSKGNTNIPRRYVPKLIRNSGIVIAPGGDILDFDEVNSEIVRDQINFPPVPNINSIEEAFTPMDINDVRSADEFGDKPFQYENKSTINNINHDVGSIDGSRNMREENQNFDESFSRQVSKKVKKTSPNAFLGLVMIISSKIDINKFKANIINTNSKVINYSKDFLNKLHQNKKKLLKKFNKSSTNRVNMPPNRQYIKGDPLVKDISNYPKNRNYSFDKKKLIKNSFRILSLLLIFFIVWMFTTIYFLVNAQVVLALTPIPLVSSKVLDFQVVNETLIQDNTSEFDRSAQRTSISSELGESIKTTQTKDMGEKAEGNITLYNKTDNDIILATGTKLQVEVATKNFNFFLKSDVKVPKRVVKTIRTDNGFVDARAIYENTGTEGNIPSDLLGEQNRFAIDGYNSNELEGIAFYGFSGGTHNIVKIISQDDIDQLKKNVESKLKEQISTKLKDKFSIDYEIITPEVKFETLKEEYTGEIGSIADKVDLFMQIKGEIIVILKVNIKKNIDEFYQEQKENLLKNEKGEMTQENTENWSYTYEILDSTDSSVKVSVKLTGKLLPPISIKEIKGLLVGKSEIDARNILSQIKNLQIVDLEINPNYLPEVIRKIPDDPNKLNLVFEKVIL